MVVVAGAAGAVDRLALGGAQHVDGAVGRHGLQRAVDRGQAHLLAGVAQQRVQLLRGAELVDVGEHRRHRGALPGGPPAGVGGGFLRGGHRRSASWRDVGAVASVPAPCSS